MCGCETPVRSANPRNSGCCARCGRTIGPQPEPPVRNPQFERDFLDGAQRSAGVDGFVTEVMDRLSAMQERYGNQALSYSPERFRKEVSEEGLDLGGWPVMWAQAACTQSLDDERRQLVRMLLQEVAVLGAGVEYRLRQIMDLFEQ